MESFVEVDPIRIFTDNSRVGYIHLYASFAYVDAKYTRWNNPLIANDPAKSIEGKQMENAPQTIGRYGTTYSFKNLSATFQINQVAEVFTDAANTEIPNATATIGKIPGYTVMDILLTYSFAKKYNFKAGINNIADEHYFTLKSLFYIGKLPSTIKYFPYRTYFFTLKKRNFYG